MSRSSKEYQRAYQEKHKERLRAYAHQYGIDNCEKIRLRARVWAAQHTERKSEVGKAYYKLKKAAIIARTTQDRRDKKRFVNAAKAGKPCADCGRIYPPYVMDFDHVRGVKAANISQMKSSLEDIAAEIAKCDLVCANCHRERTHGPGRRQVA